MNFVTGATGLVGSHLCLYLLQQQQPVTALYRTEVSKEKTKEVFRLYHQSELYDQIKWVKGNILNIPSLEAHITPDSYVYHCAAKISFDPKDHESLLKVNQEGTANMVNISLHKKVKKFCYVSSIAALGDLVPPDTIVDEETPWLSEKPHSDYALSKHGAEMEVYRGFQEGLPMVIVNPGVILGPGFWDEGSGVIFSKISKGINFYTLGSSGFVAVTDLVKVMFQLMQSTNQGYRYTIIAENINYKTLVFEICDILGLKKPKLYAKPWMTSLAWRLDWLKSLLFFQKRQLSRAMAKSLHSKELFSHERIKSTLNFEFTSIKDYLKILAEFYLLKR